MNDSTQIPPRVVTALYFSWKGKFVPIYERGGNFQIAHPNGGCFTAPCIDLLETDARLFSPGYKTKKMMEREEVAWDKKYIWRKAN